MADYNRSQRTSLAVPAVGLAVLGATWSQKTLPGPVMLLVGVLLAACVITAVLHAETLAHRVGEPYGSLVLAVAVTVIEVGLIVTLMLGGREGSETIARDTVFAAVMLCTTVIVGLSLLVAALRDGIVSFRSAGPVSAVAAIATLATLSLVLPTFTTSTPGPTYSPAQLVLAALASLGVYLTFVLVQTVRNRDLFVTVVVDEDDTGFERDARPGRQRTALAVLGLGMALVAVVGLAKVETPGIEAVLDTVGLPASFVGLVIAAIVLMPEGLAAVRAASRGRVQTSLNLGFGSALASIGLTIPAVAIATLWVPGPLVLGLGPVQMVLLLLALTVSALSVLPGRATLLQGAVHLAIGATFVVLAAVS
jgi:Ca2+:H+ antiporter